MAASCFGLPFRPAAVDDDPFLKLASFLTQVVKGRRRTARSGWSARGGEAPFMVIGADSLA